MFSYHKYCDITVNDMKKSVLLLISLLSIFTACSPKEKEALTNDSYGVFLGANDSDFDKVKNYKNILIDVDEFSSEHMTYFQEHAINVYAYLSVGSLEKYRSYYEEFKDITFMDYDNWPDERWVDVSNASWQSHISSEAERLKNLGASGLFMDNFDVYYIANEEYECSSSFKEGISLTISGSEATSKKEFITDVSLFFLLYQTRA